MRNKFWPKCPQFQRSMQKDGKIKCFLAIGVTCDNNEDCAFNLTINEKGIDATKPMFFEDIQVQKKMNVAPGTILHYDYVNSWVNGG